MDFSFVRRLSADASGEDDDRAAALKNSISEGSSRLFGSVMAKKTGLLDGLSSKFDQVTQVLGADEQEVTKSTPPNATGSNTANSGYSSTAATSTPPPRPKSRVPPPKPPAPSMASRMNGQLPRQYSADTSSIGANNRSPASRAAGLGKQGRQCTMPAYTSHPSDDSSYQSSLGRSGILAGIPSLAKNKGDGQNSTSDPRGTYSVSEVLTEVRPEAIDSSPKKTPYSNYDTNSSTTEVSVVTDATSPYSSPYSSPYAKTTSYNSGSNHVPHDTNYKPSTTSGDELMSGISYSTTSKAPTSDTSTLLAPQQKDKDLLVITPTSGAALPMPSIKPTKSGERGGYISDGDGDSSATEGCDEVLSDPEDLDYNGELNPADTDGLCSAEGGRPMKVNFSSEGLDDLSKECLTFMEGFVEKIFAAESISQSDKAKFGQLCQQWPGRLWFSRYVNAQRMNKKVDEQVFYQLVQFLAVCLFECNDSEDYVPAKTLMNMCFTFYYEATQPSGEIHKQFLYSFLKEQPIWQETRFWKAAFFDAVQKERARKPVVRRSDGSEAQIDDKEFQENITFGQLGTFTSNMRAFGLSKDLCLEFIKKQAAIANLREEQVHMLRDNMTKWND